MSYTVPKKDFPNIVPSQVPMVLPSVQPAFPTYTIIPTTMCSNPTFHQPPPIVGLPNLAASTITLLHQSLPGHISRSNYPYVVNSQPANENILTIPKISNHPTIPTSIMHNPTFVDSIQSSGDVCDLKICSVESLAPIAPVASTIGIGRSDSVSKKRKTIRIPRRKSIETDKEHQIRRLEKKLAIYHASIEEAGGREIGLDELGGEDNPLERLNRLEKKAAQIWEQICQLKGKSDRIMVMSDSFKNVNCTPYPSMNQRIERFFMRNILDLPDIVDVTEMISKVNEKENLVLSKEEISRLSKKVLQFVGNRMSQRRRTDLYEVLRSRTEEGGPPPEQDPYLNDPAFKARLEENEATFKKRLQETIGVFCDKQDKLGLNGENDPGIVEGGPSTGAGDTDKNLLCELEDSPNISPLQLTSWPGYIAQNSSESSNYETPPDIPPSPPITAAPVSSLNCHLFPSCDSATHSTSKRVKLDNRDPKQDAIVISSDEEIDQN